MGKTIMGAVVSADGYLANIKGKVGPLFDWSGNGATIPGPAERQREPPSDASIHRETPRRSAVLPLSTRPLGPGGTFERTLGRPVMDQATQTRAYNGDQTGPRRRLATDLLGDERVRLAVLLGAPAAPRKAARMGTGRREVSVVRRRVLASGLTCPWSVRGGLPVSGNSPGCSGSCCQERHNQHRHERQRRSALRLAARVLLFHVLCFSFLVVNVLLRTRLMRAA
jgi:hypothetical protein